ncbi:MAG: CHRD domain-containing protein [Candidatus Limnocylindria bacterium]
MLALTAALTLTLTLSVSIASAESQRALAGRFQLTGAAEVPGPGDADATGTAIIVVVPALDRVCWMLSWENVDGTVVAAHIHGPATTSQAAGVLVPLSVNPPFGCTTDSDADAIAANPGNYYVNVHSSPNFPGGAIRGQLD